MPSAGNYFSQMVVLEESKRSWPVLVEAKYDSLSRKQKLAGLVYILC